MRILVAGASGYIGGRLATLLQAAGHGLVLTSRRTSALEARFPGARVVAADLLQPETLPPALEGVEVAYYLAHAMSGGERGFKERGMVRVLADRATRDAEAARKDDSADPR